MIKVALFFLFCFSVPSIAQEQKPYTVFLKSGAKLTRIKDKKTVVLEKGIYARVLENNYQKRDVFNVFDNEGQPLFETEASSIVEIADDYQILPKYPADITYPPPSQLKAMDKHFSLDTQLNFHLDNIQTEELNLVYSDSLESIISPRLELRSIYARKDFPVGIGASLNYQNASWKNDFDQIQLTVISFGPTFMYRFYSDEEVTASIYLGAELAPLYRTATGPIRDRYKATLFDVGVEGLWQTDYGRWSAGTHYRSHTLSMEETSRANTNPPNERINLSSFGLMVGFHHNWNL